MLDGHSGPPPQAMLLVGVLLVLPMLGLALLSPQVVGLAGTGRCLFMERERPAGRERKNVVLPFQLPWKHHL